MHLFIFTETCLPYNNLVPIVQGNKDSGNKIGLTNNSISLSVSSCLAAFSPVLETSQMGTKVIIVAPIIS